MFLKDKRAQISFEYLLTLVFAIILVAIVTIFALNLKSLSTVSKNRIFEYKEKYFEEILE